MKILYIAPYCFGLEESLANALKREGCNVKEIIYDKYDSEKSALEKIIYNFNYFYVRKVKKFLSSAGILNSIINKRLSKINSLICEYAKDFKPDVIFVIKGEVIYPETLKALSTKHHLVVYHWDDPFLQFIRKQDSTSDIRYTNLVHNCPYYEITFTYDSYYIPQLKSYGARHTEFLMDWYDPEKFKPLNLTEHEKAIYGADVSFVGAPYQNRLEILEKISHLGNVAVWGPIFRWKEHFKKYPFLKKQYRGPADGNTAVKIYNASKIVLNIQDNFQCFTSVINRTFEIMASGAMELADDRKILHELFDIGKDMETFTTPEDALNKIEYYLAHPEKIENIRKNAPLKVLPHSVNARARQILNALKKL